MEIWIAAEIQRTVPEMSHSTASHTADTKVSSHHAQIGIETETAQRRHMLIKNGSFEHAGTKMCDLMDLQFKATAKAAAGARPAVRGSTNGQPLRRWLIRIQTGYGMRSSRIRQQLTMRRLPFFTIHMTPYASRHARWQRLQIIIA